MTTRAPVSGPTARRLAVTFIAAAACLFVGVFAVPQRIAAAIGAARHEDAECPPRSTSYDCLVSGAQAALSVADFETAETLARQAVAQEPLGQDGLDLLARSISPSQAATLRRLNGLIARLTLHNAFSHSRLMDEAFVQRRWDAALFHADVLLRREVVSQAPVFEQMLVLLQDEAGRVAVAKRLALDPPWRLKFMQAVASRTKPADAMAFFSTLRRRGLAPAPAEADALVRRLLDEGQFADLRQFQRAMLPKGSGTSLVYDSEFNGLPGPASLVWQTLPLSGGEAVIGTSGTEHPGTLLLRHDLFSSGDWMAKQLIVLAPGHYRLTLAAQGLDDQGSKRFKVGIDCWGGSNLVTLPLRTEGDRWVASRVVFTVPPEGCPAQWLAFAPITGDRVEAVQVLVDHVVIQPSAAPPPVVPPQPPRPADAQ